MLCLTELWTWEEISNFPSLTSSPFWPTWLLYGVAWTPPWDQGKGWLWRLRGAIQPCLSTLPLVQECQVYEHRQQPHTATSLPFSFPWEQNRDDGSWRGRGQKHYRSWNLFLQEQKFWGMFGPFHSLEQRHWQVSMLSVKSEKLLQDQFVLTRWLPSKSKAVNATGLGGVGRFHCWLKHRNNCTRNLTQHDRQPSSLGGWQTCSWHTGSPVKASTQEMCLEIRRCA